MPRAVREERRRLFGRDEPAKIVCIGLNYRDHTEEQDVELPDEPLPFGKFANGLADEGDAIVLPPEATHVEELKRSFPLELRIVQTIKRLDLREASDETRSQVARLTTEIGDY